MTDEMTKQVGVLHDWLSKLLYEEDPMGLARIGAPDDEYDTEARMIGPYLLTCKSHTDVLKLVYDSFVTAFAGIRVGPVEGYVRIADRIWSVISSATSSKA